MNRRKFIALMGASATWPFTAMAQEPGRTYRLGWLLPLTRDAPINVAFLDEMRRRGFIEGKNLTIEWRSYGLHQDLLPRYAAELVTAQVDVIITGGNEEIRAAQQATKTIPIVAISSDMLASGLVTSLARPNGNLTGVSMDSDNEDSKRQEILIEAVPGLRLIGVLMDVNYTKPARLDVLRDGARKHNIELSIHRVARGEEIAAAIEAAQASGATALNVLGSAIFFINRHLIMDRVAAARLPTMYFVPEHAEEGGFAAYGPRYDQVFLEKMPEQIVKIFRGTKVADIPVEQPTKLELVINLKTAKAMGVTVPEGLLVRAHKVIE
jgi:putative ABC transport system substrate-binding protein